ncbi:uncharacterized protein LOC129304659 [Prosopis cineraria]|uniref:uncharacterized protein LOC129304659 n=1 Tax=Prosopis cineraria TaxID=364024 RepID=UPI0024105D9D|nr:uncharacterized protein LOC129304659 [Prosopis cineraria]
MDSSFMYIQNLSTAHDIYHFTLQGKWYEVAAAYRNDAEIHTMPVNSDEDTALHVAANDNRADAVEQLVGEIKQNPMALESLKAKNGKGDTALHRAASIGSLEMCECIIEADPRQGHVLIEERNKKGETPLFLAALNGHMDVFFYLENRCAGESLWLCRRASDGQTALHCSIREDYYELAFEIIKLYQWETVGSIDEKGITPLHILAAKPSAFESSISNFRWYAKFAYKCIYVKPLRSIYHPSKSQQTALPESIVDAENPSDHINEYENVVPKSYWTCCDMCIFMTAFTCFVGDIFMPAITPFVWLYGLVLFGPHGLEVIRTLRKKKQKHVWCHQILDEIWRYKDVAFVGAGTVPDSPSSLIQPVDIRLPEPHHQTDGQEGVEEMVKNERERQESALFIAAENGVLEIVKKILKDKPEAIVMRTCKKNSSEA